jgi:hypothetical protein
MNMIKVALGIFGASIVFSVIAYVIYMGFLGAI